MTLIRHELRRAWKSLTIWTCAIGAFIVICLFMYPEMKSQTESISSLFSSMGAFSAAFGLDTLDFGTLKGFYGIECGNILGIGGALFAALAGISALAGEEKEGTAEFLLTHPLRRTEIVTRKLAAVLIQITALNLVVFLLAVGSIAAVGEAVPWKEIALLHLAFYLLQVELGCICLGISAFLWRGGLGIGLGLAIALYFVNIIANLTSRAEVLKYITPFGYADGAEILSKGAIHGTRLLAGAALAACGVTAAYLQYRRKDIR
ncbi:MAG: ABC transporter permease subunit [Clostridia bacterium]|nr:ABC transporter permease subunit [Clostridia bacterium]